MSGDDRARFCRQCNRHVYNLSGMTRSEAQALVSQTEGRRCVRFLRRADGTIVTRDCPAGWSARRSKMQLMGLALALAIVPLSLIVIGVFNLPRANHAGMMLYPFQQVVDWIFPPPTESLGW
jgi:hypothetical protein